MCARLALASFYSAYACSIIVRVCVCVGKGKAKLINIKLKTQQRGRGQWGGGRHGNNSK